MLKKQITSRIIKLLFLSFLLPLIFAGSPTTLAGSTRVGDECPIANSTVVQGGEKLFCKKVGQSLIWRKGDWKTISFYLNMKIPSSSKSTSLNMWDLEQKCRKRAVKELKDASFVSAIVNRKSEKLNLKSELKFLGFKTNTAVGLYSKESNKLGNLCMWSSKFNVVNFASGEVVVLSLGKFSKTFSFSSLLNSKWKVTANF